MGSTSACSCVPTSSSQLRRAGVSASRAMGESSTSVTRCLSWASISSIVPIRPFCQSVTTGTAASSINRSTSASVTGGISWGMALRAV